MSISFTRMYQLISFSDFGVFLWGAAVIASAPFECPCIRERSVGLFGEDLWPLVSEDVTVHGHTHDGLVLIRYS